MIRAFNCIKLRETCCENMDIELTDCDKEQIQFIERIQPFGALIATNKFHKIVALAATEEFDLRPSLLGDTLDNALEGDTSTILGRLQERSNVTRPMLIRSKRWKRWVTCTPHQVDDTTILEFEFVPSYEVVIPTIQFLKKECDNLTTYLQHLMESLRKVTGYDRVMVYRFASDWHGEVVAEAIKEGEHSFQGHHFPASDIPLPARELFLKNWIRTIFDVDKEPLQIATTGGSAGKIDLSRSCLRYPSSIHIEYLKNMSVGASLTLSLIYNNQLWGLIACHHSQPKYMTAEERQICAMIAKLASAKITSFINTEALSALESVQVFTRSITANLSNRQIHDAIRQEKDGLYNFVSCDAFCATNAEGTPLVKEGSMPTASELKKIVFCLEALGQDIVNTESLSKLACDLEGVENICGALAIKVHRFWLIWFRKEYIHSRLWAGNPNKAIYKNQTATRLSPRTSFNAFKENTRGCSRQWEDTEVAAVTLLRSAVLSTLEGQEEAKVEGEADFQEIFQTLVEEHAATDFKTPVL